LSLLEQIFKKEFWALPDAKKCLTGRLVLLNKSHPEIPVLGRFRAIRISSNIAKALEAYLLPKREEWGDKNLRNQFGFIRKVGC